MRADPTAVFKTLADPTRRAHDRSRRKIERSGHRPFPASTRRVCFAAVVSPAVFLAAVNALLELASGRTIWSWTPWWLQEIVALALGIVVGVPTALIMRRFKLTRAWHLVAVVALLCVLPELIAALATFASTAFSPSLPAPGEATVENPYGFTHQTAPLDRWVMEPLFLANIGLLFWWIAYGDSGRGTAPSGGTVARKYWPAPLYRFFVVFLCALPAAVLIDELVLAISTSRFGRVWSLKYAIEAWLATETQN